MTKVIYEGYRIGENGGEHWVGTVKKRTDADKLPKQLVEDDGTAMTLPKATSVIQSPSPKK